jgi:hypothetical protein
VVWIWESEAVSSSWVCTVPSFRQKEKRGGVVYLWYRVCGNDMCGDEKPSSEDDNTRGTPLVLLSVSK